MLTHSSYSETIDILYSENTFDFNHLDPLIDLPGTLLPHRLIRIHSLRLGWVFILPFVQEVPHRWAGLPADQWPPPPYNYPTWKVACEAIALMKELNEIHIHLSCLGDVFYNDAPGLTFEPMLQALCGIHGAAVFEVTLHGWIQNDVEPPQNAPFKILYPED